MKILHLNCNYIDTELHQVMIEKLNRFKLKNIVFVPIDVKRNLRRESSENIKIVRCFSKWDRLIFWYKQSKIYKQLVTKKIYEEVDLMHAYTLFSDGNCAWNVYNKYNIPYIVTIRNTDVNIFFKYMIHLRRTGIKIMRDAKFILFLSPSYKEEVFNKYVPKYLRDTLLSKTFIIPNGIDDFWLKNYPKIEKKTFENRVIKLIYVGKINKNKNIYSIQKAIKLLINEGWEASLTMIGKIEDKKVFEKLIKDKNSKYIASQDKENLLNLYREHDIFIMPSLTETFGLVYAEAISQGLPVIYSKGQGFDKQFEEGVVGFHVNSKSAVEIKDNILKIIKNYSNIQKNLSDSSKKFNWNNITSKYHTIYQMLLEERKGND